MLLNFFQERKQHALVHEYIQNGTGFKVEKVLGSGSYGVAYALQQPEASERVVLKHLRAKHKRKKKVRTQFQQEISFLKMNMHPNLPSVLDEGEIANLPYYMMEHVNGVTFEQLIFEEGKQFTVQQALSIVKELLDIIVAIHDKGVVHRDLRIPNILMKDGKLYVIDFGLATMIKEDIDMDQVRNPKKVENHASDLYYIGHFLLYLLYSTYTPVRKKEKSWQEELQIPEQVKNFIERLLWLQPVFPSAIAAREELLKLINGEIEDVCF